MKTGIISIIIIGLAVLLSSLAGNRDTWREDTGIDSLRYVYSRSSDRWPAPTLDEGVAHVELGMIMDSPLLPYMDSLEQIVSLGKTLFFDPRLSGSNQISCSSCHHPDMGWSDAKALSVGHDHQANTRNSQSIENAWFYASFFWDGRSATLEEQAVNPIENPIEMHQDFAALPAKLSQIKGYLPLFAQAYGDHEITGDRIATALAVFQKTITSGISDFDYFLAGLNTSLDDEQVLGLHLFRTKARCINCHNGPYLTDNKFHNLNVTYYGDAKREDLGLYKSTGQPEDVGKFRTPGLRNVTQTGPWFHNGVFTDMRVVLNQYNNGMLMMGSILTSPDAEDPMRPVLSPHIKRLSLTAAESRAVIAFLESLSTIRSAVEPPELPK